MAVHTAHDLVTAALKRIGVLSGIETASADLAQDALDRLNSLLETWSTEALSVWALADRALPLVAGQAVYTLGPGGDVPIRPPWVTGVTVTLPGTPPTLVPLTAYSEDEWQDHRTPTMSGAQPTHYVYTRSYPLGELTLWPIWSGGIITGATLTIPAAPAGTIATLTTPIDFPPGYYRALRDELAIELAPELGRPIDPALLMIAGQAKAQLQRVNFVPHVLSSGLGCGGGAYNWMTDE